jgi:hypothetical protein
MSVFMFLFYVVKIIFALYSHGTRPLKYVATNRPVFLFKKYFDT